MASPHRIHAMKEAHVGVAVVCSSKNYVVFENGVVLPINGWLTESRQPTINMALARYFEFGDDVNGYGLGDLDAYEMPSYSDH
jgi:hypothetical protein